MQHMNSYCLRFRTDNGIVWLPDLSTEHGRLLASRTIANRLGYPVLSILPSYREGEYVVTRQDTTIVANLFPASTW